MCAGRALDSSYSPLGRSQYTADPYFNGAIDDFRICYGALTAAEIAGL